MARTVAFLRAINVGGHTVKMDRLRALFEELGLARVETFIASGNVLFDGPGVEPAALEQRIEDHLRGALGYEVATFLRDADDLAAVAAGVPFTAGEVAVAGALSVAFLKTPPPPEIAARLTPHHTASDDLRLVGRELWWLSATKTSDSPFSGAVLERALGAPATIRTLRTIQKLAAKTAG